MASMASNNQSSVNLPKIPKHKLKHINSANDEDGHTVN
jgi:hypothetical protein